MKKKLKNRMAQLLTALLAVAVIGAFTPQVSMPAYAADGDPAMVLGSESVLKSTVNAPNAQTVWYADNDWRVIGYDGVGAWDKLDSITLLSARNIGDITEFKAHYNHDEYSEHDMDYAGSFLRERIEGTEETPGILDSFSKPEQAAMVERDLLVQKYAAIGTDGVYETEMNNVLLWPLSTREAMVVNEALRIIDPEHTDILERNYCWWLRSPGNPTNNTFKRIRAAFVRSDGSVGLEGTDVDLDAGVRPAFYLNKNAVFFTSAAEGGKDSGTAGENALKAVGTNTTNEWKVTILDDGSDNAAGNGHTGFAIFESTKTKDVVTIKYAGATTGQNEYVSVIITDKPVTDASAKITYYGRIKNCALDSDAAGTITVNTAGKLADGDTIYVFNEQYNGDKKTDFTSKLIKLDPTVIEEEQTDPTPDPGPTPDPKPEPGPGPDDANGDSGTGTNGDSNPVTDNAPAVGSTVKDGGNAYKVLSGGTVAFTKAKKSAKTVTVPDTVKSGGKTYKVTEIKANAFANSKITKVVIGANVQKIGKKAFYKCKKLKTITIKSKKLKASKVGAAAFKGTPKKITVKVPKKKKKAYKKWLYKKGISKKAKIKS